VFFKIYIKKARGHSTLKPKKTSVFWAPKIRSIFAASKFYEL